MFSLLLNSAKTKFKGLIASTKEETGASEIVAVIVLIVIVVALALIFREQLTGVANTVMKSVSDFVGGGD